MAQVSTDMDELHRKLQQLKATIALNLALTACVAVVVWTKFDSLPTYAFTEG